MSVLKRSDRLKKTPQMTSKRGHLRRLRPINTKEKIFAVGLKFGVYPISAAIRL